ncbi:hypothetical protein KY289_005093 [Solanum tuberosum]|nr:hypothetical protein KY289_005093 [Solanum tuberosum]
MIKELAKSQSSLAKNKGIIQLAAATLFASDESHSAKWEAFNSAEKILITSQGNNKMDAQRGLLTLHDALLLTVVGYILAGENFPSSTVGRLFKSGFGRFGLGQTKPSLADHDVILIFVVGGINGVEVREAQEALSESSRPEVELILGGTTLLTPNNMFELLLGDYCCV